MKQIALTKAALVTPFILYPEATVLIDHGKILAAGAYDKVEIPSGFREVPLDGLILAPGLIDQHIHGGGGAAVMSGVPDQLVDIAKFHATHGVTSFLATTTSGTRDQLVAVARSFSQLHQTDYKGAHCLGLHLEGPYLAPQRAGIHCPDNLRFPVLEEVLTLHQISGQAVRMITMAPELPGAIKVASILKEQGFVVSIGHSNADYETALAAVEAGFSCVTHCYNQLRPFHHRDPGVLGVVFTRQDLPAELIVDGIHLHQAAVETLWKLKGSEQLILVTDAMPPTGMPDGSYLTNEGQLLLNKGELKNSNGKIAGSSLTLDKAVRNMVAITNCDITEAIRMATYNPAKLLGINKRKGSVYPGKDADLIALTTDLDVIMTMVEGEIISGLVSLN